MLAMVHEVIIFFHWHLIHTECENYQMEFSHKSLYFFILTAPLNNSNHMIILVEAAMKIIVISIIKK